MHFDRGLTDPQGLRNSLIGRIKGRKFNHLALSGGELIVNRPAFVEFVAGALCLAGRCNGFFDGRDKDLGLNGLFQKVACSVTHCVHGHTDVAVPGEKNHRQRKTPRLQHFLQIKPRESGHAHVGNEASRARHQVVFQKRFGACVRHRLKAAGLQQQFLRHQKDFIVVHEPHQGR